jgi:hypothetical protein
MVTSPLSCSSQKLDSVRVFTANQDDENWLSVVGGSAKHMTILF